MNARIVIELAMGGDEAAASALAERVGASVVPGGDAAPDALAVRFDAEGTALVRDGMVLRPDLSAMLPRLRKDRLGRELLVRAARVKGTDAPVAVDATAGLGEDALLLAAAGFKVFLFESDPVIAALLVDSLRRASASDMSVLREAVARMHIAGEDSVTGLPALASTLPATPDVIYLDPMFPERRKSAAVKKKFQLIHHLECPCEDEEALLQAAIAARPRKIVVKRPLKGAALAAMKPSYALAGKAIRYDVIVPPR